MRNDDHARHDVSVRKVAIDFDDLLPDYVNFSFSLGLTTAVSYTTQQIRHGYDYKSVDCCLHGWMPISSPSL